MAIKGEVAIELTNVNTGKKRIIRSHNMVTNGMSKFFKFNNMFRQCDHIIGGNSTLTPYLPLATRMLGGVYVLGNERNEDPDNFALGISDDVLAYCGNESNTSSMMKGSYNSIESGETSTGYQHVWDFNTAQSVGTIKSIGLANTLGAQSIWGNGSMAGRTFGSSPEKYSDLGSNLYDAGVPYPLYYDEESEYLYAIGFASSKAIIKKFPLRLCSVSVNTTPTTLGDPELVKEYTFEGTASFNDVNVTDDMPNKTQYVFHSKDATSFYYITVNFSNLNNIQIEEHSITGLPTFTTTRENRPCICGKYLYYIKNWGSHILAKVNMSDISDYTELDFYSQISYETQGAYKYNLMCATANVGVTIYNYSSYYASGNTKGASYSLKDETMGTYSTNSSASQYCIGYKIHPLLYMSYYAGGSAARLNGWQRIHPCTKFLSTIFNLPSPVTKTAADVMKIIYTLTDA